MDRTRLASTIEHSLLRADASEEDVLRLCSEAVKHGFYSVCINPVHIKSARSALAGTDVRVTSVVGFPLGAGATGVKVYEAMNCVLSGADELDMVMDIGAVKDGRWTDVCRDMIAVVMATPGIVHKVIIEACYLSYEEKKSAALAVIESGAEYVKTSTGFGPGGATAQDVRLLHETVKGRVRIKAAGGIRSLAEAKSMLDAGAHLIGTSSGVAILEELERSS